MGDNRINEVHMGRFGPEKDEQECPQMKKFAALMILCCLLAVFPAVCAETAVFTAGPEPETVVLSEEIPESAAENYILQAFGLRTEKKTLRLRSVRLSNAETVILSALQEMVSKVARGEQASAVCEIPIDSLVEKTSYTAEELGVDSLIVDHQISNDAVEAFYVAAEEEANINISRVVDQLRANAPFEMYWFGNRYSYGWPGCGSNGNEIYFAEDGCYTVSLTVSSDFSVGGAAGTTEVDTSWGSRAQAAADNARAIVDASSGKADFEKLDAYRAKICELVDYNHEAAGNDSTPYGNPWQAVWVFDGDDATKVVCEGYSKAFKYLCDLSTFRGSVSASLVTGTMIGGTGAGPHMWNLVSVSGKNYLVDVTNCDDGSIGAPDKLFMAGYSDRYTEGSRWGYIYEANGSSIKYLYDSEMSDLYTEEELTVESEDYTPPAANTWTVTFEINNGAGGDMEDQTVTEGIPTRLNANAYTPVAGYRFAGWNTEADGSGTAYADEAEVTLYADLTLFAIWERDTWTVTFMANNGTEETAQQEIAGGYLDGEALAALSGLDFTPPEHYHFREWNTAADGSGTSYADKGKVVPEADMTLYAIWEEDAFYTLSFDANGGAGTMEAVKAYAPFKVTLPANAFTFTGCHPNGWDKKPGSNYYGDPAYADGAEITLAEDTVLYAHWAVNNQGISLDVIDRIDWTGQPAVRHMSGGFILVSMESRVGEQTQILSYGECDGGTNYMGTGDTTVYVTAVPAESYEFVGWYSAEQEDVYNQTLTPVDLVSEEASWSFEAKGHETRTRFCAVFRYAPKAFGTAELTLPADLIRVEENAFEGIQTVSAWVPDSRGAIGAYAFKDCTSLRRIRLPKDCEIGDGAFDGCRTDPSELEWNENCSGLLAIFAPAGGSTQAWAEEHHILFVAE